MALSSLLTNIKDRLQTAADVVLPGTVAERRAARADAYRAKLAEDMEQFDADQLRRDSFTKEQLADEDQAKADREQELKDRNVAAITTAVSSAAAALADEAAKQADASVTRDAAGWSRQRKQFVLPSSSK